MGTKVRKQMTNFGKRQQRLCPLPKECSEGTTAPWPNGRWDDILSKPDSFYEAGRWIFHLLSTVFAVVGGMQPEKRDEKRS